MKRTLSFLMKSETISLAVAGSEGKARRKTHNPKLSLGPVIRLVQT
jgi:hypothetical protein